ncbi:MAG: saccharopine dehydrogenase NADP-binding domain-containing protein [Treponema sp.]|nr:saccharopine dehydrogenase NADP-binding domain-containing protein [Treponema sp.]
MTLNEKLVNLKQELKSRKAKIMIIGLGSVGNYLLDYLMSTQDENIEIIVVGRTFEKMEMDVNIVKIASLIRRQNKTKITIEASVDLNDVASIQNAISKHTPDIIINSSRAYSGLKYGSISWSNFRAYGIWTPLSIKYTKNIIEAYANAGSKAIVINTSYSDAVIPWLKSAGKAYPDFGSGNVNHLVPRIKLGLAAENNISDWWNIDITYAVAHFHDVVISKEGQTEGVKQMIYAEYKGKELPVTDKIFAACKIAMPVDQKRNMMNASSNFEIIQGILNAVREGKKTKVHCPGFDGNIGGYPVVIDGSGDQPCAYIDESKFSLQEMKDKNRESIYLDGIENVCDSTLYYTDELIAKVKDKFNWTLPKSVAFTDIDKTAQSIIDNIINVALQK